MKFFAIITIDVSGETYGWQGEWTPAHRGITRQDAFWDIMGKAITAANLPPAKPRQLTVTTTFFSLEPQELPR